ncbi:MAG: hypothetical protein KDE22_09620 [Rhodobacterales bacterium]|nr:hypothetical protein [Rhodobacterales bacterium]
MKTITCDIWQFVRLMDLLEDQPEGPAFRQWAEAWTELDARLAELAATDHEAYSELMMDRQITLDCPGKSVRDDAARAAERVIGRLDRALNQAPRGDLADSLAFEKREMEDLLVRLKAGA